MKTIEVKNKPTKTELVEAKAKAEERFFKFMQSEDGAEVENPVGLLRFMVRSAIKDIMTSKLVTV